MVGHVQLHRPERSEITTSDRGAVQNFLSTAYGTDVQVEFPKRSGDTDNLRYTHARTAVGLFASEMIDQCGAVRTSADRFDHAVVFMPDSGRVECYTDACHAVALPGEMLLAQCTDGLLRTELIDVRSSAVVLDQALLMEATAAESPSAVRFTGHRPVSVAAAQTFRYAAEFVCSTVLVDDEKATPLVLAAAGRLLASAALAAFPSTFIAAAVDESSSINGSPLSLRRAVDYIEENAHRDIGVADIAATVYLTPRTVQYMFRRHLDITPTEYLRRIRLDRARKDLVASDRSTTTVAATAARWGFAHTGRFAVLYRQSFGESPHETLRR